MSNSISVELAEFLVSASDESSGEIGIDASYSGRCMYGQTCLGLTFENIQSAFGLFESLRYFGSANFVKITHELADFLAGSSKDSYGYGVILYNTSKSWPAEVQLPKD